VLTSKPARNDGFTLVELIISIAILGIIMASLTGLLFTTMQANRQTQGRLDGTRDEQFSAVYFAPDVQGATDVQSGVAARCGAGIAVLDLRGASYDVNQASLPETVTIVSYVFSITTVDGVLTGRLERRTCEAAAPVGSYPMTPARRQTIARSLAPVAPVVTCTPLPCGTNPTNVTMLLSRLGGQPSFVLVGTRRSS
jgi:prepilin-type N-terminal cleavage/methylation domain-containing protein